MFIELVFCSWNKVALFRSGIFFFAFKVPMQTSPGSLRNWIKRLDNVQFRQSGVKHPSNQLIKNRTINGDDLVPLSISVLHHFSYLSCSCFPESPHHGRSFNWKFVSLSGYAVHVPFFRRLFPNFEGHKGDKFLVGCM